MCYTVLYCNVLYYAILYYISSGCLDTDAWAVRYFVQRGFELFCSQSFAKNFGLYNERVGNLTIVVTDPGHVTNFKSQMTLIVRAMYSNPPSHGARIVDTVLQDTQLFSQWRECIHTMAHRYVLYCTLLYCTVLYCTVMYWTVLYCIVLYCTILYLAHNEGSVFIPWHTGSYVWGRDSGRDWRDWTLLVHGHISLNRLECLVILDLHLDRWSVVLYCNMNKPPSPGPVGKVCSHSLFYPLWLCLSRFGTLLFNCERFCQLYTNCIGWL